MFKLIELKCCFIKNSSYNLGEFKHSLWMGTWEPGAVPEYSYWITNKFANKFCSLLRTSSYNLQFFSFS